MCDSLICLYANIIRPMTFVQLNIIVQLISCS